MPEQTKILGLIPARGGSKGIPQKNLAPLLGRPLIAYTIAAGLRAGSISRLIVSTDDQNIAATAKDLGAEVPFLRPTELADDEASALSVVKHALAWLKEEEGWEPDAVVYLQPTSPLRSTQHIEAALELLISEQADTVVSVVEVPHNFNPESLMKLENGELKPFMGDFGPFRRQDKPKVLARNGPAILALRRATVQDLNTLYGPRTLPLPMKQEDSLDIDGQFDLDLAAWILNRRGGQPHGH